MRSCRKGVSKHIKPQFNKFRNGRRMNINSQMCPSCKAQVSLNAKFCTQCGKLLSSNRAVNELKTENITPLCPYCSSPLKKEPTRKTKCPSCRKPIFVKSRPTDKTRKLVTQEQADDIEHEWAIKGELEALPEVDKRRFEQVKSAQIDKYGSEMPKQLHDALHSIRRQSYQRQGLEYVKEGHFGLWRNTRLDIASLLDEEGKKDENKLREALATYLEVCYIDLNGPQNSTKLLQELGEGSNSFEPREGDLAIGLVRMANFIIEQLSLSRSEVKVLFQEHNKRYLSGLKLPLSIDKAWNQLEPDLVFKNEDA